MRHLLFIGCVICFECFSAAAEPQDSMGPTIEQTNKLIENANYFRLAVVTALRWKPEFTLDCRSCKGRLESVANAQPVIQTSLFGNNELALMQAQQQAEENALAQLATFSALLFESIQNDCFEPIPIPRVADL